MNQTKTTPLIIAGVIVALLIGVGASIGLARLFYLAVTDVKLSHSSVPTIEESPAETLPGSPKLTIRIRADGTILSGDEILDDQSLETRLSALAEADPEAILRLSVEPASRQKDVVKLMEACQRTGLEKVLFADEPAEDAN